MTAVSFGSFNDGLRFISVCIFQHQFFYYRIIFIDCFNDSFHSILDVLEISQMKNSVPATKKLRIHLDCEKNSYFLDI